MSITLYGMWTSAGKTVTVFLGGLDCGDYTVQNDGSVVVPYQSDPDALLTAAYLSGISSTSAYGNLGIQLDVTIINVLTRVTVPCVIGRNYSSSGETARPQLAEDIKSPMGPGLGKLRRVHQYGMLVQNAIGGVNGLKISAGGTSFPVLFRAAGEVATNHSTMFSGIFWGEADGNMNYDGTISWSMTRPYPVTVSSIEGFIETSEQ